jgi:hypothetical protein
VAIRTGSGRGSLRPNPQDPFTDLLFNTLIGFVLLFFLAIIFLNPEKEEASVDLDAQYVITVTWPDNSPDDIDTWVEDPRGSVAWFRNPNAGLVHLDRDDRGMLNDTLTIGGETVANPLNQEIVAIRGVVPGEYTVNVHYYESETNTAVNVSVRVARINPVYKVVFYKSFELSRKGVERTAVRFTLAGDGTVIDTNTLEKKLVTF